MMDDLPRELEENGLQARLDRVEKRFSQLLRRHNVLAKSHAELQQRADDFEESLAEVTAAHATLTSNLRETRQFGAQTRLIQQSSQAISRVRTGNAEANQINRQLGAAWERIASSDAPEVVANETIAGWKHIIDGPPQRSLPPVTVRSNRW